MHRMACVDLPAFPLQLLLADRPEWRAHPAVVVADDKPQARVLYANELAYGLRILPGVRYAAALSLTGALRAGVVPPSRLSEGVEAVAALLRRYTPHVEPSRDPAGTFWLDGRGLGSLFDSATAWGHDLVRALDRAGFAGCVVVGWSRFNTAALARAQVIGGSGARVVVFRDLADEAAAARRVPLDRIGFPHALREGLRQLGVTTVGAFVALPPEGVRARFGDEAHALHALASGARWSPLEPAPDAPPMTARIDLDFPVGDVEGLAEVVRRLLAPWWAALSSRGEALRRLSLALTLDLGGRVESTLEPAEPTLSEPQVVDLVRRRLDHLRLSSGAVSVEVTVEGAPFARAQASLADAKAPRDLAAARRALARLRAEYGETSVVRAVVTEAHLPEGRFRWEPTVDLRAPEAVAVEDPPMVRRVFTPALAQAARSRHTHDDGWILGGFAHGAVTDLRGPYVIAGGWWAKGVHRSYHFAETRRGDLLWVYEDRERRRWVLQGAVE